MEAIETDGNVSAPVCGLTPSPVPRGGSGLSPEDRIRAVRSIRAALQHVDEARERFEYVGHLLHRAGLSTDEITMTRNTFADFSEQWRQVLAAMNRPEMARGDEQR